SGASPSSATRRGPCSRSSRSRSRVRRRAPSGVDRDRPQRVASSAMIRARGIRKSYRLAGARAGELPVLRGVDFDVADGEFAAVVGRSGSGKSTLLALLGGLDSDYTGELTVAGKELRALSDAELSAYRNTTVGFVFQAFHLLEHLSCEDNVALPALFRVGGKESKEARLARARELMESVGIADKIGARPGTLSGGQKQRLAIARALYHRPKLLI